MQVINNNELFTQIAAEESSVVSGGDAELAQNLLTAALIGTAGLTRAELIVVFGGALIPQN